MSAILLKQKYAEEKYDSDPPLQRVVRKGELVLEIPPKDRITRTDGSPSHNYCLYSNNAVTLYDDGIGMAPLEGAELDYLLAITEPPKRIIQYLEPRKMKWIMELKHGDIVSFRLPQGSNAVLMPKGRVRHYGRIPGHEGVMFGIEILDRDCKGKGDSDGSPHFQCGHNNAVYVPMDKIIKLDKTVDKPMPADEPIKEQPKPSGPAAGTRSKTEGKDKSLLEKAKEKFGMGGASAATIRPPTDFHSRFCIGDRVVIQTVQGGPAKGWVRWVGPVKMSKSAGGITVSTVGIETSRQIDHENDFPGLHISLTGSHGHDLFPVPPTHGRIFLAEQLVLLEEEYRQHKREEHSAEVVEAKKFGLSVDELHRQREMMSAVQKEGAQVCDNKKPSVPSIRQENEERGTTGTGAATRDNKDVPIGPEGTVHLSEESLLNQRQEYEKLEGQHNSQRHYDRQRSHDDDYYMVEKSEVQEQMGQPQEGQKFPPGQDPEGPIQYPPNQGYPQYDNNRTNQEPHRSQQTGRPRNPTYDEVYQRQLLPNHIEGHHSPSLPSHLNTDRVTRDTSRDPSPSSQRRGSTQSASSFGPDPTSYEGERATPRHPSVPSDPDEFTVGTMVEVQMERGPPMYGIIQWIGTLPQFEGYYAGVELDNPFSRCSDGTFNRRRYFKCPPGTGFFCLLSSLRVDQRYMEPNQVPAAKRQDMINPIQTSQYDDSDIPGGPELFSRYIGDEHGIQGHYNSCYLDATVFGLFALSDSFDVMLLEEPELEIGQKIKNILWKGIVNPLRRFGVARFESIMELRNELENLGRMKGANKDEKDPEEFLNLLFKEILHVNPFISIKRPFGVEKEFFVQLFLEIEQDQTAPPSSEKLIKKMFHEQNISFTTVPSKLLLQMPRFGKEFKMFSKIIPALEMDVKPLLDTASRGAQQCKMCLDATATISCSSCTELFITKESESLVFFCDTCCDTVHKHRPDHKWEKYEPKTAKGADVTKFSKMQLLSVICIETSHYVCFTRDKDRWLFHDSMANRLYDTYNIPRVTDVSEELNHWVYTDENQKKLLQASPRDIPECVRRFTQDIYMCVYINPNLDRYGPPPDNSF